MQDYLLPTLAYAGGPAECAYFAQAAVVHENLLGRVTPVVPRFSATLVEPKIQSLLDRYHLDLPDLFHGPNHLRDALAARALSPEIQKAFEDADAALDRSLSSIREVLGHLDPTLVDAARHSASKMHYQLNRLHARAGRAELRRSEILNRHADSLSNALFPANELQERKVGALYFLARYGLGILDTIYSNIHSDCVDHQIIPL